MTLIGGGGKLNIKSGSREHGGREQGAWGEGTGSKGEGAGSRDPPFHPPFSSQAVYFVVRVVFNLPYLAT